MTIPAISNYEIRPPAGGWGITYVYKGQKFHLTGGWRTVAQKIAGLLKRNGEVVDMDEIFAYCNSVWCERDPQRCMNPAQRSQAMKTTKGSCGRCGGRRRIR